ncbi:MAG: tRNA pseudouridine(55) synthase TruB [Pseudothermotoga sp.]
MLDSGILLTDKPEGPTSHDVVNEVRKKLKLKKVGHAGTLDPFASGLLVLGIGSGTRILEYLMNHNKVYLVTMRLGLITETFDITGQVVEERPVNLSIERIIKALKSFIGSYMQVPPAYSARRYKGERLYELAREGKIIRLPPRQVTVYRIEQITIQDNDVTFITEVSAGTYIRSLCMDVGYALGCGATAVKLRRLSIGPFEVTKAINVFDSDERTILSHLKPLSEVLDMPKVYLKTEGYERAINGNTLRVNDVEKFEEFSKGCLVQVIYKDELLCIAKTERASSFVKTLIGLNRNEPLLKPVKVLKEKQS